MHNEDRFCTHLPLMPRERHQPDGPVIVQPLSGAALSIEIHCKDSRATDRSLRLTSAWYYAQTSISWEEAYLPCTVLAAAWLPDPSWAATTSWKQQKSIPGPQQVIMLSLTVIFRNLVHVVVWSKSGIWILHPSSNWVICILHSRDFSVQAPCSK